MIQVPDAIHNMHTAAGPARISMVHAKKDCHDCTTLDPTNVWIRGSSATAFRLGTPFFFFVGGPSDILIHVSLELSH
jgi:hypothetical protein